MPRKPGAQRRDRGEWTPAPGARAIRAMAAHPQNAALAQELASIEDEIAELRLELGIGGPPPRASPSATPTAADVDAPQKKADEGTGLSRSFSSNTYDKMLRNPSLSAEQREKIVAMKERRQAKEAALETSMTELVRTASEATQAALREAMGGLEEARRAAGFGAAAPAAAPLPAVASPSPSGSMTDLVRTATPAAQQALRESMAELAEYKRTQAGALAWKVAPEPEPEQSMTGATTTDLVRTGSPALQQALSETMRELAEAKKAAGFGEVAADMAMSSMSSLVRTASPATKAALQQSMRDLAEAKKAAGFGSRGKPAAAPIAAVGDPEEDEGAALKRQFSTEMYDKMLKNPKISAEQRCGKQRPPCLRNHLAFLCTHDHRFTKTGSGQGQA